jgi:hypothetical protein
MDGDHNYCNITGRPIAGRHRRSFSFQARQYTLKNHVNLRRNYSCHIRAAVADE